MLGDILVFRTGCSIFLHHKLKYVNIKSNHMAIYRRVGSMIVFVNIAFYAFFEVSFAQDMFV